MRYSLLNTSIDIKPSTLLGVITLLGFASVVLVYNVEKSHLVFRYKLNNKHEEDKHEIHVSDGVTFSTDKIIDGSQMGTISDEPGYNQSALKSTLDLIVSIPADCQEAINIDDRSPEVLRRCNLTQMSLQPDIDHKIDQLEKINLPFMKNYRNPCWYESLPPTNERLYRVHKQMFKDQAKLSYDHMVPVIKSRRQSGDLWRLRCLPLVYVIGVAKCGTTDLWSQLIAHPLVVRPATKEPMFWNCNRWVKDAKLSDYLDVFDEAAEQIRNSSILTNDTFYHPSITVDMSVETLFRFEGTSHLFHDNNINDGPAHTTPLMIRNLTPQAKIILLVRNPTERLFSEYIFFNERVTKRATSAADFHALCKEAVHRMEVCLSKWSQRYCVYEAKYNQHHKWVRLVAGMYAPFVRDWLEVFPDMLVIRTEDYHANRTQQYTKILEYLQLDVVLHDRVRSDVIGNKGPSHRFEMLPQTRELLDNFYKPLNLQLSQLLNDPAFIFDDLT